MGTGDSEISGRHGVFDTKAERSYGNWCPRIQRGKIGAAGASKKVPGISGDCMLVKWLSVGGGKRRTCPICASNK